MSRTIVVEHATEFPGLDAMVAAELVRRLLEHQTEPRTLCCVRVRPEQDFPQEAAKEYVATYGSLLANGFFWIERAMKRTVEPWADEILAVNEPSNIPQVISINPWLFGTVREPHIEEALRRRAAGGLWVKVLEVDEGFECHLLKGGSDAEMKLGCVSRDSYGRSRSDFAPSVLGRLLGHVGLPLTSAPGVERPINTNTKVRAAWPRIVIVGEQTYIRSVYPPVLGALGDAADQLDLDPAVDILSSHDVATVEGRQKIGEADGLFLPGGSDMSQTEGQIEAAIFALDRRIPTLGLCLGMQTMTVAFARGRAGLTDSDLEEVKPKASCLIFRRLCGVHGDPVHRLGLHESIVRPGTRLAAIFSDGRLSERMNHRYHLNPAWLPRLEAAGLRVGAISKDGLSVDAIECEQHPFFLGLQGHPEMSSRIDRPHPAIIAFLASASRCHAFS